MEEKSNVLVANQRANKEEIKPIPRILSSTNQIFSETEGNQVVDKQAL